MIVKCHKDTEWHSKSRGGEAAWLRPLDACVRIAGSLVAAEVGHGLVQARAADAHEREEDQAGG